MISRHSVDTVGALINGDTFKHSIAANTVNKSKFLFCELSTVYSKTSKEDAGWGCGYRNIQMLLSSLGNSSRNTPTTTTVINTTTMESISDIQRGIENAWKCGFDPIGRDQLGSKLENSKKWIGATEVATLLYSRRISCQIVDFWRSFPTSRHECKHGLLMEWIRDYFKSSDILMRSALNDNVGLYQTSLPPLYLQFQGHSITIIGVELEIKKGGGALNDEEEVVVAVWVLDPDTNKPGFRRPIGWFVKDQYQIVSVNYDVFAKKPVFETRELYDIRCKFGGYSVQRVPSD